MADCSVVYRRLSSWIGWKKRVTYERKATSTPSVTMPARHGLPAEPQHDRRGEHAQELDGRQEDEGQRHGADVGVAVGLVDLR